MTRTRTKLFIMIFIGYLKLKIVHFVINLCSNQQNIEDRTSVSVEQKMKIEALEQKRRVNHIREVCNQWKQKSGQSKVNAEKLILNTYREKYFREKMFG